jgi:hypothetical protein
MLANFLTPSGAASGLDPGTASNASYLRVFANPKATQTDWYTAGDQLVDFKVGFLNKIPLIELVFAIALIIGAIYYFAVQRKKPYEEVRAPDDEDLTGVVTV